MSAPTLLMVDPAHFEVAYAINPWMQPNAWLADDAGHRHSARTAFSDLSAALVRGGADLRILPGVRGAPDLVFPANAAVVMDGRAVMARFLHPERQVEEPILKAAFDGLVQAGLISQVERLPEGLVQEGAGDFIWDGHRGGFWAGFGQRSSFAGMRAVEAAFERPTVRLELANPRFYHLDTCLCPLPGGEIFYYPPAFTAAGRAAIRGACASDQLIEASDEDAARFCVNAVALGRTLIMAEASDRLRGVLEERGYQLLDVNLAPFILSGGGAYCMTLRLDRTSQPAAFHEIAHKEAAE